MDKELSGQTALFENADERPLAARLRPATLDEFAGQEHLVGKGKLLRRLIEEDKISSMIFWGPPGTGKTTLAHVIANSTKARFINFSAVTSGIKDIKAVMKEAEENKRFGTKTILFVDEIHRFNKAQQDAFLPYVEAGSVILIGATTENPSFEVNGALLSRCRVLILRKLSKEDVLGLLQRALKDERGFGGQNIKPEEDVLEMIAVFADGDARNALTTLEMAVVNGEFRTDEEGRESVVITKKTVEQCTSKKLLLYDKNGEEHYNLISALHKSMRNSDPDAAVYWLARMLEAGEDPLYIARRIVRFASEDVGIADPKALELAVAAYQACRFIGMPECSVNLAEAAIYLSLAAKSNSCETAYNEAKKDAATRLAEPVPMNLRNAPTSLMKELGYGSGYKYAHDYEGHITDMQCLPDSLRGREYYRPSEQGLEARAKARLQEIKASKRRR